MCFQLPASYSSIYVEKAAALGHETSRENIQPLIVFISNIGCNYINQSQGIKMIHQENGKHMP